MKGIKLFLQLKSLSKEELKALRKAVQSPYFNTNKSVELLFEKLRKQYPNFDDSPRGKRKLYDKMFPNESYSDIKLRRLFTFLSQVIEQFLLCEELKNDEQKEQQMLVKIYEKRNVQTLFEQGIERLLEKEPFVKSTEWYHDQFVLLITRYSNLNHAKYDTKDNTLDQAAQCLDSYFALQKLKMAIGQKNREKILNQTPNYGFLDLPKGDDIPNNKLFQLYTQSHNLLTAEQPVNFAQYENLLFTNHAEFSNDDKLMLFYNGLNYLIRQTNQGDYTNESVTFRWYKWGLEQNIFTINERMSAITFNNIVLHACLEGKFSWSGKFIEEYAAFLNKDLRADEVAYCKIVMLFYKKDFRAVIFKLSTYEFSNRYVLKTKNLMVRTYFELFLKNNDYFEVLDNTMKTYENYLYRNSAFNEQMLQAHLNFIQILKGITVKVINQASCKDITSWLHDQMTKRETLVGKNWLSKKYGLMKGSPNLELLME